MLYDFLNNLFVIYFILVGFMESDFVWYILAGFVAQIIDGTLGMAYGVSASTLLASVGLPPAAISATVHAAECFTTGASALSHHSFGNIDRPLFRRLIVPGIIGAVVGAYILSELPGDLVKPYVAAYLLVIGALIFYKSFRTLQTVAFEDARVKPLAFTGALFDAIGGGGWGPIVTSNLVARGLPVRQTIGSVNAAEFFITLASSVTFIVTIGLSHWSVIAGLALGGVLAAPIGAWACKHVPAKPLMRAVGILVILTSLRTLAKALHWI